MQFHRFAYACAGALCVGLASAQFWRGSVPSRRTSLPRSLSVPTTLSSACEELAASFPQWTFLPGVGNYTFETNYQWSEQAVIAPQCVFAPDLDTTLAAGLQYVVRHGSLFGVRSGGHMPVRGAASTSGVLISVSNFRSLKLHPVPNEFDVGHASISPGHVWGEIYSWIDALGYSVSGGRVYSVGTSLLLGGGISYFSGTRGWAANDVVNFHVVLANGTIVGANKDQHPDLWWALKGGSNNFGIITRYDLRLRPRSAIFGGTVLFNPDRVDDYLKAHADFLAPGGGIEDPKAAIMPSIDWSCLNRKRGAGMIMMYEGAVDNPRALENFTRIARSSGDVGIQTFANLTDSTAVFSDRTFRQLFYVVSMKAHPENLYMINSTLIDLAIRYLDGKNASVNAAIQVISKSHLEVALAAGGDPMDLDPAGGSLTNVLIGARWDDAGLDDDIFVWSRACIRQLRRLSDDHGTGADFVFLNDAGTDQNPLSTYGSGKNVHRLRSIARTYDPQGIFQSTTGGFKLFGI